jgi:hypothetical protein
VAAIAEMARQELKLCLVAWLAIGASIAFGQSPPDSFTPLNDLGSGLYLDLYQGGLYANGSNEVPAVHAAEGLERALAIQPLDALGQPADDGKYVLLSIGMSNTQQEFGPFVTQATAHPAVNHENLAIVNGAQGGEPAEAWISPNAETFDRVAERLATANVTESQVAAVWLKQANPRPTVSLPSVDADAFTLLQHLGDIVRAAKVRYPNLQSVFLSSRTYAGYATSNLNPEPYAYESGLAVKWLIEAQINQMDGGGIDPLAGDLDYASGVAPWIAWGPYLWADGLNPRSDGLTWEVSDFSENDGTHPSQSGREKVATMLLDYVLDSPFARPWFLAAVPGDYNQNGVVDAADYTVWRDRLGQMNSLRNEDPGAATPGLVDEEDYDFWKSRFGATAGSAALTPVPDPSATQVVPESAPLELMIVGIAGVFLVSRSRGRYRRVLNVDRHARTTAAG